MQPFPFRRRAALLVAGVALLPLPADAHAIVISADPAEMTIEIGRAHV